jgi:GLPGLI family protein
MKRIVFCILFLSCVMTLNAQYFNLLSSYENLGNSKVIDSAYLKCSYKLLYLKDSLKPETKSIDQQILLIGKKVSKYYSRYALEYNSFLSEYIKTHDTYPSNPNKGAWSFEVFKNYPKEKATVTDIASILQGSYLYEEPLSTFNWTIMEEEKTVLSYRCKKAMTIFRGRSYLAWFTTEIPISNGPWKFGGLPGLILLLSDDKCNFVYQCDGIEQLKTKNAILFYQIDYKKTKREDLNKLYQRFHNNFKEYMNSLGISVDFGVSNSAPIIPYNPMELE